MFYWKTVIVLFHTIISITKFVKMREFSPKRIIRIIRIRNNYGYSGVVCVCVCVVVTVRRCPAIFSPTNGVLTCDAANLYGSRCSVACIPGYSVGGQPAQTECLPDRQWSNDVPTCRRKLHSFGHLLMYILGYTR